MFNKSKFLAVFVLASLLSSGVPLIGLMSRASALMFVVSAPGLDGKAGKKVIVISLNDKTAAAVSENSGALQAQPALSVFPASVSLATTQGVNPADPPITISNTGPAGSVLNWSAAGSAPWIGLSQASGTVAAGSSNNVIVGANVAGLAVGTYAGTITISDQTASNSPQTVAVTMNITAPPVVQQLDHSSATPLEVNLTYGRQLITVPTTVTISAVGLWISPGSGAFGNSDSNLTIYTDNNGSIGDPVATSGSVSLGTAPASLEGVYSFNPTVTLALGKYWLVPSSVSGNATYLWGSSSDIYDGGYWYYAPSGGQTGVDAYFRLITQ